MIEFNMPDDITCPKCRTVHRAKGVTQSVKKENRKYKCQKCEYLMREESSQDKYHLVIKDS